MPDLSELSHFPIVVAPMAGGASTTELVVAAAEAGALGMLAGGYKTADGMRAEIDAINAATHHAFGVNVFVPQQPSADPAMLDTYLRSLEPEAARLGATLGEPAWDDDGWDAKIQALLERPPALVSFTFGCPPRDVVEAFRASASLVIITVTNAAEARLAAAAGADCLCAQGLEAGAHRGTFINAHRPDQDQPLVSLLDALRDVTDLPLIAAGGIADERDVAAAMAAGAVAVQIGTAFLRCDESGAHPAYKAALANPRLTTTAITRAFSGRRARGLVNAFMRDHPNAPPAYPQINNATRPLRAAAAAQGDADRMSLWAGQGFRSAAVGPAGEIIGRLARSLSSLPSWW